MFLGLPSRLMQGLKGGKCCHRQGEKLNNYDIYLAWKNVLISLKFPERQDFCRLPVSLCFMPHPAPIQLLRSPIGRFWDEYDMVLRVECSIFFKGKPSRGQMLWTPWRTWSLTSLYDPWRIVLQVNSHKTKWKYQDLIDLKDWLTTASLWFFLKTVDQYPSDLSFINPLFTPCEFSLEEKSADKERLCSS